VNEFIPPHRSAGRVALGQSVAKAEGGKSIGIAVGGVLYQIKSDATLAKMREVDLKGDVHRSIGLALSDTPGRILYVFETSVDGKKEKVVMGLPLVDNAKPLYFRFPTPTAGEAKGALWASEKFGGVITDRGVVWFDDHENLFAPMVMTQPPAPGHHFGDESNYWTMIPNPKNDKQSVLVGLAADFEAFPDYVKDYTRNQTIRAVRIDEKGLSK
jgi:hypothetical protein